LAKGISTTTGIPVSTKVLKKIKNTKTQTQLNKTERLLNTIGSFSVSEEIMNYKTIAIVDDVVTTGATINAICQALMQKNNNLQITIFSLALAQQE
jgi:predicted amidophosphoribosyltransferase